MVCLRTGKSSRIFSTLKPVWIGLVTVLMEFLKQHALQRIAERWDLDAVYDILRERVSQQAAGFALRDAARLQIKHRFGVELADGCAVGAADVISVNLQLGLGVDDSFIGKDEVFV